MCILVLAPNVPEAYRLVLSVPAVAFPSLVACRVFRAIKLGFIEERQDTTSLMVPFSQVQFTPPNEIHIRTCTYDASQNSRETMATIGDTGDDHPPGKQTSLGDGNSQTA